MGEKKFLTIQKAAMLIGVSPLTLRNWDNLGKFRASRHPINNYRVYTLDQVSGLVQKLGMPKLAKKLIIQVLED